jgi:hypothetical protein
MHIFDIIQITESLLKKSSKGNKINLIYLSDLICLFSEANAVLVQTCFGPTHFLETYVIGFFSSFFGLPFLL